MNLRRSALALLIALTCASSALASDGLVERDAAKPAIAAPKMRLKILKRIDAVDAELDQLLDKPGVDPEAAKEFKTRFRKGVRLLRGGLGRMAVGPAKGRPAKAGKPAPRTESGPPPEKVGPPPEKRTRRTPGRRVDPVTAGRHPAPKTRSTSR